MPKKMDLLERIDEVTANSVTPEQFKETWGYGVDEYVANMMEHLRELKERSHKIRPITESKQRRVARPAAAAAEIEPVAAAASEMDLERAASTIAEAMSKHAAKTLKEVITDRLEEPKVGKRARKAGNTIEVKVANKDGKVVVTTAKVAKGLEVRTAAKKDGALRFVEPVKGIEGLGLGVSKLVDAAKVKGVKLAGSKKGGVSKPAAAKGPKGKK